MINKLTIFSDGGSRGNPGNAGVGYVINKNNKNIAREGEYIGFTTNNSAEYIAIFKALNYVFQKEIEAEEIECLMDSELVVNQLMGKYKIKKAHLKNLYIQIQNLILKLKQTTCKKIIFTHIPRNQNKEADLLVNQHIDLYLNKKGCSRQTIASEENSIK